MLWVRAREFGLGHRSQARACAQPLWPTPGVSAAPNGLHCFQLFRKWDVGEVVHTRSQGAHPRAAPAAAQGAVRCRHPTFSSWGGGISSCPLQLRLQLCPVLNRFQCRHAPVQASTARAAQPVIISLAPGAELAAVELHLARLGSKVEHDIGFGWVRRKKMGISEADSCLLPGWLAAASPPPSTQPHSTQPPGRPWSRAPCRMFTARVPEGRTDLDFARQLHSHELFEFAEPGAPIVCRHCLLPLPSAVPPLVWSSVERPPHSTCSGSSTAAVAVPQQAGACASSCWLHPDCSVMAAGTCWAGALCSDAVCCAMLCPFSRCRHPALGPAADTLDDATLPPVAETKPHTVAARKAGPDAEEELVQRRSLKEWTPVGKKLLK